MTMSMCSIEVLQPHTVSYDEYIYRAFRTIVNYAFTIFTFLIPPKDQLLDGNALVTHLPF